MHIQSDTQSVPNQSAINAKLRTGDRVQCFRTDGTLDAVVYTVQGFARAGRKCLPYIFDNWSPVVLKRWVRVT